jgi:hypothetical protein
MTEGAALPPRLSFQSVPYFENDLGLVCLPRVELPRNAKELLSHPGAMALITCPCDGVTLSM